MGYIIYMEGRCRRGHRRGCGHACGQWLWNGDQWLRATAYWTAYWMTIHSSKVIWHLCSDSGVCVFGWVCVYGGGGRTEDQWVVTDDHSRWGQIRLQCIVKNNIITISVVWAWWMSELMCGHGYWQWLRTTDGSDSGLQNICLNGNA